MGRSNNEVKCFKLREDTRGNLGGLVQVYFGENLE